MNQRTLIAIVVSFLLLFSVILLNRISFKNMTVFSAQVDHTREVIINFERIDNHLKSAQIYTETYQNIREREFYIMYHEQAIMIDSELKVLSALVKDNPVQKRLVDKLTYAIGQQMPVLLKKNIAEIISSGESFRLLELYNINSMILEGIRNEDNLLIQRKANLRSSTKNINQLSYIFAGIAIIIICYYFINNLLNLRKRQWLEGFLESVLNTSPNAIMHFQSVRENQEIKSFRVRYANRSVEAFCRAPYKNIIGKTLNEVLDHGEALLERFIKVVEEGHSTMFEMEFNTRQGRKWYLFSLGKMEDGVTAAFQDITQLKAFEDELKMKIKELEHSNQELEQYAYVASHDLQEPLRKIRSFGSYLYDTQAEKLDEKGKQHLEKILASAERMSVLIRDVLSFSSMKKEDRYQPVDLNETMRNVLADFDLAITQRNASVQFRDLPVIEAIPLQMNQLFYNLLNNAFKFAREDQPPQVTIKCRELGRVEKQKLLLPPDLPFYEILFEDNGIGFSPEYAEQIFGLFKRLNDKQRYPGSGIGLALCKKVVENHQGRIMAKGEEMRGARFYIYLPARQS